MCFLQSEGIVNYKTLYYPLEKYRPFQVTKTHDKHIFVSSIFIVYPIFMTEFKLRERRICNKN
jgi:hypothetical protein